VNVFVVVLTGVPAMWIFVRGMHDAGQETMVPDKSHKMYGGIYEKIRHPQALGEAPMWLAVALLLNLPLMAVLSLLYLCVWYWWCVEEEKDLLLRYGEPYADSRARTGMFFPKRRGGAI
jgi:protein-S-isoprenylcysteine O-methyltransferase Ste14